MFLFSGAVMSNRILVDLDRYLFNRSGNYSYKRKIPLELQPLDGRKSPVQVSLHTQDLAKARGLRDAYEKADNELWASYLSGIDSKIARSRYESAVQRASALGFSYLTADELSSNAPAHQVVRRIERASSSPSDRALQAGTLGMEAVTSPPVSEVLETYINEICAAELRYKSDAQRKMWEKVKRRAVSNFIDVIKADKPVREITREDATTFYKWWLARISHDGKAKKRYQATSGNRDVGNMRVLLSSYFSFVQDNSAVNPFDGLNFKDKKIRSRPPFSMAWIRDNIISNPILAKLNPQARGIMLALIETGARPSELCNLIPSNIHLGAKIPFIKISGRDDAAGAREIKTRSSEREIPLVGIALEVFKKHPKGFPRYQDKETNLSATLNKFFFTHELFETEDHKIYSFRHSFEDRMKEAGLDTELRMMLMGHTIDRPTYGSGGSLKWKADELSKITLPFDAGVV